MITVDGSALVEGVGVGRTLNVLMLGAVAGLDLLPFDGERLWAAVERRCPARFRDANRRAYEAGLKWAGER